MRDTYTRVTTAVPLSRLTSRETPPEDSSSTDGEDGRSLIGRGAFGYDSMSLSASYTPSMLLGRLVRLASRRSLAMDLSWERRREEDEGRSAHAHTSGHAELRRGSQNKITLAVLVITPAQTNYDLRTW